jgi:hypothetical protein
MPAIIIEGAMSQQLHIGFDLAEPASVQGFMRHAPESLYLAELAALFAAALIQEDVAGHYCFMVAEDGALLPLIGDDPVMAEASHDGHVLTMDNETPEGITLRIRMAVRTLPDRNHMSRLHMLVAVYTTHLLPLVEVNDGSTALDAPTDAERQCLSLVTAGWSNLDIGERFDLSAPAVRVQIGRIRSKLGLGSMR